MGFCYIVCIYNNYGYICVFLDYMREESTTSVVSLNSKLSDNMVVEEQKDSKLDLGPLIYYSCNNLRLIK